MIAGSLLTLADVKLTATAHAVINPAVLAITTTADVMAHLVEWTDAIPRLDPFNAADLGACRLVLLAELERRAGSVEWLEGRAL